MIAKDAPDVKPWEPLNESAAALSGSFVPTEKYSCKFQTSIWNKILDLLRVTVGLPEEAASFAQQQAGCQHR